MPGLIDWPTRLEDRSRRKHLLIAYHIDCGETRAKIAGTRPKVWESKVGKGNIQAALIVDKSGGREFMGGSVS